jgi:hypothetical protein
MEKYNWKEFGGTAARRVPDAIRSSINPGGEITFDIDTFEKLGEPEAMFLLYDEAKRTIGLRPAHPDAQNAVLVRIRHERSNRVVRSMPFLRENGIEIDRTLRFTFPYIDGKVLVLNLRTAVTCSRGGWKKIKKRTGKIGRPISNRTRLMNSSHLKHTLNDHGKDIWIEEEDHLGRPSKWYSLDSKGRVQKHTRDALGISITREEE